MSTRSTKVKTEGSRKGQGAGNDAEAVTRQQNQVAAQKPTICYVSPGGEQYDTVFYGCVLKALNDCSYRRIQTDTLKGIPDLSGIDLCIADISSGDISVSVILGAWLSKYDGPTILLRSSRLTKVPFWLEPYLVTYNPRNFDPAILLIKDKDKEQRQGQPVTAGISPGSSVPEPDPAFGRDVYKEIEDLKRRVSALENRSVFQVQDTGSPALENADDDTVFQYAIATKNLEMAEEQMAKREKTMPQLRYLDVIVEQVAMLGSQKAGGILIEKMEYFLNSNISNKKKVEYLGVLITYISSNDLEEEYLERIINCTKNILDERGIMPDGVSNQINRLYYGAYLTTNKPEYLDMAIYYVRKAIEVNGNDRSYLYNLSGNLRKKANLVESKEKDKCLAEAYAAIRKCMEMSRTLDKYDDDHLTAAVELYFENGNEEWMSLYQRLWKMSPIKAVMLKKRMSLPVSEQDNGSQPV